MLARVNAQNSPFHFAVFYCFVYISKKTNIKAIKLLKQFSTQDIKQNNHVVHRQRRLKCNNFFRFDKSITSNMYQLNFDINDFLNNIWQKKPAIFRGAFCDFVDPITAEELAGLAMEDEISSRIVLTKDNDWEIVHGPFHDYAQFGESQWQLLVQAANHWHEQSTQFTDAFRFLPDWRFDDLMVSFATPNGGVGPHIDNYDVFIVQGRGKRQWKIGDKGVYKNRNNDPQSALVEDFEPIIDTNLEAGDILYIPPGFPHCGKTITESMSYSLGYRAPSQQELFSSVADFMLDNDLGKSRFTSGQSQGGKGLITGCDQQALLALITEFTQSPERYQKTLGCLLSQNRFEQDICPEETIDTDELLEAVDSGYSLTRVGGLKVIRLENDCKKRIFVDGIDFNFDEIEDSDLVYLADNFVYENEWLETKVENQAVMKFLLEMCKQGYLYLT